MFLTKYFNRRPSTPGICIKDSTLGVIGDREQDAPHAQAPAVEACTVMEGSSDLQFNATAADGAESGAQSCVKVVSTVIT